MLVMQEDERRATRSLHEVLSCSPVGLRWQRILRRNAGELEGLLAVDPMLRRDVRDALTRLADGSRILDPETVGVLSRVLDGLARRCSVELQRDVSGLRDELALARGYSLTELLVPRATRS